MNAVFTSELLLLLKEDGDGGKLLAVLALSVECSLLTDSFTYSSPIRNGFSLNSAIASSSSISVPSIKNTLLPLIPLAFAVNKPKCYNRQV